MTAADLMQLLAKRHAKDVFVPEAKTGSSWVDNARRLDAWVMKRSWSPVTMIGYEVKVSRSDFLRDTKWHEYLPYCHEFSFVCPHGLIQPDELPDGIGLVWATKSGTMLRAKVPARRREIEQDWRLLVYVLMSRSRIVAPGLNDGPTTVEQWQQWVGGKAASFDTGRQVARRIGEIRQYHREQIRSIRAEVRRAGKSTPPENKS